MRIQQIYTNSPLRNFSYLVYDERAKNRAFCIDPWDADQISAVLEREGLSGLSAVINTHEHADHTRGNAALTERYQVPIWAHENAQYQIKHMDRALKAGEKIPIDEHSYLEVLDTPGHTFAHLSLLLYRNQEAYAVFSGDTFFHAGVGNCYNGGDPEVLYETITAKYALMEDNVHVYPGHDYMANNLLFSLSCEQDNLKARASLLSYKERLAKGLYLVSTMGLEHQINTFLRLDSSSLRQTLIRRYEHLHEKSSHKEFFLALRKLRDNW